MSDLIPPPLSFNELTPMTVNVLRRLVEAIDDEQLDLIYVWSEHFSDDMIDGVQICDLAGNRVAIRNSGTLFTLYEGQKVVVEYEVEADLSMEDAISITKALIRRHLFWWGGE